MDFIELAKRRCSVRAYEDRKVEPEKLERILVDGEDLEAPGEDKEAAR